MNKLEQNKAERSNISKYHTPSCANYIKRAKNAIFINPSNSLEHEMAKLKECYLLRQLGISFITEAVRNKKVKGKERRVDVVNLATGEEIEIETDPKRAARFDGEEGVRVVKLWEKK